MMLRRSARILSAFGGISAPGIASSGTFQTEPSLTELALRLDNLERSMSLAASSVATTMQAPSAATDSKGGASGLLDSKSFTELYEFSSRQPLRRYDLRRMMAINTESKLKTYATFLSREVRVRLAHAAAELAHAPFGFGQMEAIRQLRVLHEQSYVDMCSAKERDFSSEDLVSLCAKLHGVHRRHHITSELMAKGIHEFVVRNHLSDDDRASQSSNAVDTTAFIGVDLYTDYKDFQAYLERVFANRVKVRFLIGHYIECVRQLLSNHPNVSTAVPAAADDLDFEDRLAAPRFVGHDPSSFVGFVCKETNMAKIARRAVESAQTVMASSVSDPSVIPRVDVAVHGDENFNFVFAPKQAYNIITALVAHAIKMELRKRIVLGIDRASPIARPIQVLVSQAPGQSDVVVRITDHGGGIPPEELEAATTFLYSGRKTQALNESSAGDGSNGPVKGWMRSSLRLPIASVLSRCYGGDLTVASIDGHSTTVCFCAPTSGLENITF